MKRTIIISAIMLFSFSSPLFALEAYKRYIYAESCLPLLMEAASDMELTLQDLKQDPKKFQQFVKEYKGKKYQHEILKNCSPPTPVPSQLTTLCSKNPAQLYCIYDKKSWNN